VLKGGVGSKNRVVGLDNRVGKGRGRVHAELKLRLLAVIGRQALKDERTEAGAGSSTEGVEDKESLQASAVVCQPANLVHHDINLFLSDGVMATGICRRKTMRREHEVMERILMHTVARGIFLSSNKGFRVEETPVRTIPDLVNDIGLEVNVQRTGHVFARGSFGEESAEATIVVRR
jgi:hypothetical protein